MSRPNFENIDLWLFEYAEGNLTPDQVEQLKLFVFLHPELELEMDAWEGAKVTATKLEYPATAKLIKKPSHTGLSLTAGLTALIVIILLLIPDDHTANRGVENMLTAGNSTDLNSIGLTSGSSGYEERIQKLEQQIEELASQNKDLQERYEEMLGGVSGQNTNQREEQKSGITSNTERNSATARGSSVNRGTSNSEPSILSAYEGIGEDAYADNDLKAAYLLPIKPIQPIQWKMPSDESESISRANHHDYKRSFRSTVKSISHSIQRMMDNPIALKNSRDPQYGLPGLTAQDINFSSVGSLLTTRVQTLSRIQFPGTDQEQLMNTVNIDGYSYGIRGGIGVQLYHSTFHNGGIQNGGMALTYAPKFSVNRFLSIEPSVRFKMGAKVLDYDRVSSLNQVEIQPGVTNAFYPDGTQPIGHQLWYKDMGLGLMVNTKWFFAGVNADNLFHHQDNIYTNDWNNQLRSTTNFTATMGTDWENAKENMRLSPYVVFNANNHRNTVYGGANFQWNWFTLGAAVSSNAEPIASVGMKFKHFVLSYTADYSKSNSLNKQLLSHQVSIRINGNTSRFGKRLTNL